MKIKTIFFFVTLLLAAVFTAAQHPAAAESTAVPTGFTATEWQAIQAQANQLNNAPAFAQQAYIKASNAESDDRFGDVIALSGDTLVVGAPYEDSAATGIDGSQTNGATDSGAVYVFVRSGSTWTQQAYIKANNSEAGDQFGYSVAIFGDTLIVGAPYEDSAPGDIIPSNSLTNAGAAYVFIREAGVWSQQAMLKAANAEANDIFGGAVTIGQSRALVGASGEDSNGSGPTNNDASAAGAAYVFLRTSGVWAQEAYLKASNAEANDEFGHGLALGFDSAVVSAPTEDSNATGVNGNQSNNDAEDAGAAYVFQRSGPNWSQQAYLKASNTEANDWFGYGVGLNGTTVAVSAPREDSNATGIGGNQNDNTADNAGAVYLFVRPAGVWQQQAYLKASNSDPEDYFGWRIALGIDTLLISSPLESSGATGVDGDESDNSQNSTGAGYFFQRVAGVWSQTSYLKASNSEADDYFGSSLALSGSTVVVGAYGEDGDGVGDENNNDEALAGAAYAFVPAEYGVNTATAGAGTGTVTLDPDVPAYPYGAVITATAVADSGSVFTGWSGDLSGTASPTTLLITGTRTITATFALVPPGEHPLTVAKVGTGSGTVTSDPAGIACGDTCSALFTENITVTLTAEASPEASFDGWSGACTGTAACTVTMDMAQAVTATFTLLPINHTLTVTPAGTGAGMVTSDPAGIDCGNTCVASFSENITVTLTAEASSGSTFEGWSGACTGTAACTVTMDMAQAVTATFTADVPNPTYAIYLPLITR